MRCLPKDSEHGSSGTASSFSMHLSGGSDASDESLLTEDVLLQRLEHVEQSFIAAADAVFNFLHASLGG